MAKRQRQRYTTAPPATTAATATATPHTIASSTTPPFNEQPTPRVIVIGAGVAGLTCARELKQRRYDVLVLEARHRCGGRVKVGTLLPWLTPQTTPTNHNTSHTTTTSSNNTSNNNNNGSNTFRFRSHHQPHQQQSQPVDLGGALIHGIQGNPVFEVIQKMGLPTFEKSTCLLLQQHQRPTTTTTTTPHKTQLPQPQPLTKESSCSSRDGKYMASNSKGEPVDPETDQKVAHLFNQLLEETFDTIQKKDNPIKEETTEPIQRPPESLLLSPFVPETNTDATNGETNQLLRESQLPQSSSLSSSHSSFGDVFMFFCNTNSHYQSLTVQERSLFDWHKANLEVSCGTSFEKLGWTWNEDEPYGFDGAHVGLDGTSWNPFLEGLSEGLDIWKGAPVTHIRMVQQTQNQLDDNGRTVTDTTDASTTTTTTTCQESILYAPLPHDDEDDDDEDKKPTNNDDPTEERHRSTSLQPPPPPPPAANAAKTSSPTTSPPSATHYSSPRKNLPKKKRNVPRPHPRLSPVVSRSSLPQKNTNARHTQSTTVQLAASGNTRVSRRLLGESPSDASFNLRRSARSKKGVPEERLLELLAQQEHQKQLKQQQQKQQQQKQQQQQQHTLSPLLESTTAASNKKTTKQQNTPSRTTIADAARLNADTQQQKQRYRHYPGDDKNSVQVTLEDGTVLRADSVVCTLPLGILKLPPSHPNSVQFIPPLPLPKRKAIQKIGCGLFNKCAMVFSHVFWQNNSKLLVHPSQLYASSNSNSASEQFDFWGIAGEPPATTPYKAAATVEPTIGQRQQEQQQRNYLIVVHSGSGGTATMSPLGNNGKKKNPQQPTSSSPSLPMLVFWFGGDFAKHVEEWTDTDIVKDCMKTLETVCGVGEVPPPLDYTVTRWGKEKYSRGSFSYIPPGVDSHQELQAMSEAVFAAPDKAQETTTKPSTLTRTKIVPKRQTRSSLTTSKHFTNVAKPKQERADIGRLPRLPPRPSILFAGEHTTPYHPSTIHGAYLSGLREAYRLDLAIEPALNQYTKFSKKTLYQRTFTVKRRFKLQLPLPSRSNSKDKKNGIQTQQVIASPLSPSPTFTNGTPNKDEMKEHVDQEAGVNNVMTLRKRRPKSTVTTPNGSKKTRHQNRNRRSNGVVVVQQRPHSLPSRRSNRLTVGTHCNGNPHDRSLLSTNTNGRSHFNLLQSQQEDASLLRAIDSYGCTKEGMSVIHGKTLPVFSSTADATVTSTMTELEMKSRCEQLQLLRSTTKFITTSKTESAATDNLQKVDKKTQQQQQRLKPESWREWLAPETSILRNVKTHDNGRARSGRKVRQKKIVDM